MYENNQYPNQEQRQGQQQGQQQQNPQSVYGTYGSSSYSNYDFGRSASNASGNYGSVPPLNQEAKAAKETQKQKKPSKAGNYLRKALFCASLGLFFGLCAGVGFYAVKQTMGTNQTETLTISQAAEEAAQGENLQSDGKTANTVTDTKAVTVVDSDITGVVKKVMPAMVSIGNEFTEEYSYFGQRFQQEAQAAGSGIIVGENDTELLIVTNYHVIENADKLTVTFLDSSEAEAQLKGTNAAMDLAVLAVPLSDIGQETRAQLVIADLGDSDELQLGEPVIAIGNALGYGQSVTNGIISALDREVELSNGNTGTFIQTNAAINPGNSGGALLNIDGQVIGINSNKIGGETIEGMGYAIPISAAKPIISELMQKSTKTKVADSEVGYMGIQPATVTSEISQMYGMPQGVYVTNVLEGTPAAQAGLLNGDIITAIDGSTVTSYEEMQKEMLYHAAGTTIELTVQRMGSNGYEEMTFELTLATRAN